MSRPRVLVLFAHYSPTLSYYDDWVDAFRESPAVSATCLDLCTAGVGEQLRRALPEHDAVVLLHSTNGDTLDYLRPVAPLLAGRKSPLAAFVGNEVNLPGSPMAAKIELLGELGAELILTQLLPEAGEWLYAKCDSARVASVPHALQPAVFRAKLSDAERPIDIGVRAARYTAYLGDNDRNRLLDYFSTTRFEPPLRVDISTDERLSRPRWAEFLSSCRGTVSTEAGSWYLERDDRLVGRIREWVLARERSRGGVVIRADSTFRRLGHRMPWWLRSALRRIMRHGPLRHEASFSEELDHEEVFERFFRDRPRAPVYTKAISSRHFDAIGTRTCQIMLRGRYNDILEPDRHYLALDPDLENASEVLAAFRDPQVRDRVSSAALELALAEHTYAHRVARVAELLDEIGSGEGRSAVGTG